MTNASELPIFSEKNWQGWIPPFVNAKDSTSGRNFSVVLIDLAGF